MMLQILDVPFNSTKDGPIRRDQMCLLTKELEDGRPLRFETCSQA